MNRFAGGDHGGEAVSIAERSAWPDRFRWEEGLDALRFPGLYDLLDEEEDEDLEPFDLAEPVHGVKP